MQKQFAAVTAALLMVLYVSCPAAAEEMARPAAVERLAAESHVKPKVRLFDKRTKVRELIGRFTLEKTDRPDEALYMFLERHREAFGFADPRSELVLASTGMSNENDKYEFQQTVDGFGIWGNTVVMEVSPAGELVLVVNRTGPTEAVDEKPAIKRSDAVSAAAAEWKKQRGADMPPCASELLIYDGELAYDVKVPVDMLLYHIFVDASDGGIIDIVRVDRAKSENCH